MMLVLTGYDRDVHAAAEAALLDGLSTQRQKKGKRRASQKGIGKNYLGHIAAIKEQVDFFFSWGRLRANVRQYVKSSYHNVLSF